MALEYCPKCNRKLGPPLRTSGRQVCVQCGWSDRPRQGSASTFSQASNSGSAAKQTQDLTPDEIQKLLNQASSEALQNMKPRKQQDVPSEKKKRFPFLGF